MKIIGITGKSGSGKTTLSSLLAEKLNCDYINIDKIGHKSLLQPKIANLLCENFGSSIKDEFGNLDRKKIGNIVFSDKNKMEILNKLTWDYMQQQLDTILSSCNNDFIILEWFLLPQSKYWKLCNTKIFVDAPNSLRKTMVIERDHISEEYFDKRDSSGIDYSNFEFDYIFNNDYSQNSIYKMIETILTNLAK